MTQFRPIGGRWRPLAGLAALFAVALAGIAAAVGPAAAIELEPGQRADLPGSEIAYIEDSDGRLTLEQALAAYHAGSAQPLPGDMVNFGAVFTTFWLFVPMENAGQGAGTWHVALVAPFFPAVASWASHGDGSLTTMLDASVYEPFERRPVRHRAMISGPFTLQPGEQAVLVIRFTAGGAAVLPFSLESEASLGDMLERDAAVTGAFYAFSLAGILFFAVFSYAVRVWNGLYYAGLFLLSTLLNAQIDGLAFQFLWPSWPHWNGIAALVLWNLVAALGFWVAAMQRDSEAPSPRFRRAAWGLAAVSLGLNALIPFVAPGILIMVGYSLFVTMLFAHAFALLPLLRRPSGGIGNAGLVAVIIVGVAVGTLVVMFLAGAPVPPLLALNAHRIFYLVTSMATMATLTGFIVQLRRDHDEALEQAVVAARRDAALNRELFEAERNYARARDLAAQRQRQLASASHDIKQPLASLRLSLDTLGAASDPEVRARLKDAFDYLEGLTGTYLADARERPDADVDADADADGPEPEESVEPYPLALIIGTVEQMFREQAVSKGLSFDCTGSELHIAVPPLPLLRLVSNLVANAVKYTVAGTVTVSAGPTGDGAFIAVADTGPGMSADALAELRKPGRKGEGSQGEGLGLAIGDDIARSLGVTLAIESTPGRGTRCSITIPSAPALH